MAKNLSTREKILFDHLKGRKRPTSIDELTALLAEKESRPVTRNSVTVAMKYLAAKLAGKYKIQNDTGKVGAGHKSSFLLVEH